MKLGSVVQVEHVNIVMLTFQCSTSLLGHLLQLRFSEYMILTKPLLLHLLFFFHSISVPSVPCDSPVTEVDNSIIEYYIVDMGCFQGISHEHNDWYFMDKPMSLFRIRIMVKSNL